MKSVNQSAAKVLNHLFTLAEAGEGNAKIDNTNGRFMPVCVKIIGEHLLSVAHYGEQNCDAMRDPDMVFWRDPLGSWYPVSYRNDYAGLDQESVVEWKHGLPYRYISKMQADQAQFANQWMMNIQEQQGVSV